MKTNSVISIVFCLLAMMLCGCVANLTHRPPYQEFIHKPLVLQRPALLGKIREDLEPYVMTILVPADELYLLIDQDDPVKSFYEHNVCTGGFVEVPEGTPVELSQVFSNLYDGGFSIIVYGIIDGPGRQKKTAFQYHWKTRQGGRYQYFLTPAPWERDGVDDNRDVGFMGKTFKNRMPAP